MFEDHRIITPRDIRRAVESLAAGDFYGHPFRGNQYEDTQGPVENRDGSKISKSQERAGDDVVRALNIDWDNRKFISRGVLEIQTRDWGDWVNPRGMEREEDYDYKTLTRESEAKLAGLISAVQKRHPEVEISHRRQEKNWLSIYIKPRAKP